MSWSFLSFNFLLNSILLGVGLAMDAFSVSMANGLNEPQMHKRKMIGIAGTFALFQIAMPLIGWICVHTVVELFSSFQKFIPWIALLLLAYIGGNMLKEGIQNRSVPPEEVTHKPLHVKALLIQGIATAIDALSVGFTIADYTAPAAITESVIIGLVTFVICLCGVLIGRKFGVKLAGKASILGGVILIGIGLEIWIKGVFF